jgi:hypothetical protein
MLGKWRGQWQWVWQRETGSEGDFQVQWDVLIFFTFLLALLPYVNYLIYPCHNVFHLWSVYNTSQGYKD